MCFYSRVPFFLISTASLTLHDSLQRHISLIWHHKCNTHKNLHIQKHILLLVQNAHTDSGCPNVILVMSYCASGLLLLTRYLSYHPYAPSLSLPSSHTPASLTFTPIWSLIWMQIFHPPFHPVSLHPSHPKASPALSLYLTPPHNTPHSKTFQTCSLHYDLSVEDIVFFFLFPMCLHIHFPNFKC